jgi:hypothetical protein
VRTVRCEPIDFDALARAALEQAAMNQGVQADDASLSSSSPPPNADRDQHHNGAPYIPKEPGRDRLA